MRVFGSRGDVEPASGLAVQCGVCCRSFPNNRVPQGVALFWANARLNVAALLWTPTLKNPSSPHRSDVGGAPRPSGGARPRIIRGEHIW